MLPNTRKSLVIRQSSHAGKELPINALYNAVNKQTNALQRSMIAVTPCPPAAQIEINPRPCPATLNNFAKLATMRPPVAAKG